MRNRLLDEGLLSSFVYQSEFMKRELDLKPKPIFPDRIDEEYSVNVEKPKYHLSDVEKEIVKVVSETHPQLSPAVIFSLAGLCSWKYGEIVCAPAGSGKSTILEAVANANFIENVLWVDALTPAGAKSDEIDIELSEKSSNIFVDDLSTFIDSYAGEESFKLFSQLLYKGQYLGYTRMQAKIREAEVKVIAAATPIAISEMIDSRLWFSHVKDRFVRLHWFYYNRPEVMTEESPKLPEFAVDLTRVPEWRVSDEKKKACVRMLMSQTSETRAELFVSKLLTGHARLCGRQSVTDEDANWLLLYRPLIEIEKMFSFRFKETHSKGYYTASTLKFIDLFPEVLFWISEKPIGFDELREKTDLSPSFLREVLDKIENQAGLITVESKKLIHLKGEFEEDLSRLHRTFEGGS